MTLVPYCQKLSSSPDAAALALVDLALVRRATDDEMEDVRLAAVHLLWMRTLCDARSNADMHDELFIQLSSVAVVDGSSRVRTLACALLGSVPGVSVSVLLQALDKTPIAGGTSDWRCGGDAGGLLPCDPSAGTSRAVAGDAAPAGDAEIPPGADFQLARSAACGVFVHTLEDDHVGVRMAAIDSMCEITTRHYAFAVHAFEPLVDMVNDDIEEVRINAIHSLRKVCIGSCRHAVEPASDAALVTTTTTTTDAAATASAVGRLARVSGAHHAQRRRSGIVFEETHLAALLRCLDDPASHVRLAVHELLTHISIASAAALLALVRAAQACVRKYPEDRNAVWMTMSRFGERHAGLVRGRVTQLLQLSRYYSPVEPSIDDMTYVCVLILVCRAAVHDAALLALLPAYMSDHYAALLSAEPQLFRGTKGAHSLDVDVRVALPTELGPLPPCSADAPAGDSWPYESALLNRSLRPIDAACELLCWPGSNADRAFDEAKRMLDSAAEQLRCVGHAQGASGSIAVSARFHEGVVQLVQLRAHLTHNGMQRCMRGAASAIAMARELIVVSERLRYRYVGLSRAVAVRLAMCNTFGHAALAIATGRATASTPDAAPRWGKRHLHAALALRLAHLAAAAADDGDELDADAVVALARRHASHSAQFTGPHTTPTDDALTSGPGAMATAAALSNWSPPPPLVERNALRETAATLRVPTSSAHRPIELTHLLPVRLRVQCYFTDLERPEQVRLKVTRVMCACMRMMRRLLNGIPRAADLSRCHCPAPASASSRIPTSRSDELCS